MNEKNKNQNFDKTVNNEAPKKGVSTLISEAKNIAIIPSKVAGFDAFCAGVGLFHMLKEQEEKDVTFIFPGKVPEKGTGLIKNDDITTDVKKRSLLVSIDYSESGASKVHYSTEDDILYLKVSPIPNNFNKDQNVKSRITGFDFDLIIVIGAQSVHDLGSSYKNLDTVSKISKVVNIDITDRNENFGYANIVNPSVNSLSLLVLQNSPAWEIVPNEKAAKALLEGIVSKELPHRG